MNQPQIAASRPSPERDIFDNDWNWRDQAPVDLHAAIKHLRKLFDDAHWKCGTTTQKYCFALLHDLPGMEKQLSGYRQAYTFMLTMISNPALQRLHSLIFRKTPPAFFKAYFGLYVELMAVQARLIFKELAQVGIAQQARLKAPALDWAMAQTQHMVRHHRCTIRRWVRDVCDEQVLDFSEDDDEWIFWRKWQAPALLMMEPARNRPYDPTAVWSRLDTEMSDKLLRAFELDYVVSVESVVKTDAGNMALEIAKKPLVPAASGQATVAKDEPKDSSNIRLPKRKPGFLSRFRSLAPEKKMKYAIIFSALSDELKAEKYCEALDNRALATPAEWRADGCPNTYARAYKDAGGHWRQKIQDEKTRYRERFDACSPPLREEIIGVLAKFEKTTRRA